MGYLLIFVASACFAGEFALVKSYERSVEQKMSTVFFMMFARYIVGAFLALCLCGFSLDFSNVSPWMVAIMSGVLVLYNILGVAILSRGNLAIYSMFMMIGGMFLPLFHGVLFMNETLSPLQIVGVILLLAFIALQTIPFGEKQTSDKKTTKGLLIFTLLCLLAFVDNGSLGIIRTHAVETNKAHEYTFAFCYCFLTATVGGAGVLFYLLKNREDTAKSLSPCVKPLSLLTLAGIGCISNVGDILLLVATGKVAESVMYPVVSGATIVFSAIAAWLLFKEKMKRREIVAVVGAALATLLFIF